MSAQNRSLSYVGAALALLAISAGAPALAQDDYKVGGVTERVRVNPPIFLGPPSNDDCAAPLPLACNTTADGSTAAATDDSGVAPTCVTSITAPGVWYAVQGNGGDMQVTTCFPTTMGGNTDYDTKLNVYTSDCPNLGDDCVGGNDDGSPSGNNPDPACVIPETGSTFNRASTVNWTSVNGQEYLVLVQGFGGQTGNFTLGLNCAIPVELTGFEVE